MTASHRRWFKEFKSSMSDAEALNRTLNLEHLNGFVV